MRPLRLGLLKRVDPREERIGKYLVEVPFPKPPAPKPIQFNPNDLNAALVLCRFHPNCTKKNCPYVHETKQAKNQETALFC